MKNVIVLTYLIPNLILSYIYINDIYLFFQNEFYNDGWRYFLPIMISDVFFFVALLLIFLKGKPNGFFLFFMGCILAHNFIVITGEYFVPFIGVVLVFISFIAIFKWQKKN